MQITHSGFSQRGAALAVSMVFLLVLTLLAVSGMSSATLELTMAGNEQYRQNEFQAAETGIADTLVNSDFSTGMSTSASRTGTASDSATYESTLAIELGGLEQTVLFNPNGKSVSSEKIKGYFFLIQSTGHAGARDATATNSQ